MNRRSQHAAGAGLKRFGGFVAGVAGLALVIECAGCASSRPAPLVIEHPLFAAPESDSRQDLSLKLVTYNIWGLPSWMTGARSGRYPRIARELEARKSAPAYGHWSIARPAWQHTFFQQSGLMTLSRFPIIGGQFYPFSRAAFPDRFVNKGVLKTTVRLANGQVLNIWNVHLQEGGSAAIRFSQVRELVARVRDAQDGQVADVVAGDFNCTPDSPLYRELSEALGPSAQELSGNKPFVTWDALSREVWAGETLDHIFVRRSSPFQSVRANPHVAFSAARREDRLSDHFGIEAVLNLSTEPRLAGAIGPGFNSPAMLNVVPQDESDAGGD